MDPGGDSETDSSRRLAVRSAAAIYAGAGVLSLIEAATPGGPAIDPATGIVAIAIGLVIALLGERVPFPALAAVGPLGAAMIAYALATSDGSGDAAVLYIWPVLWESYFFGRRGAIGIVLCVAVAHGLALLSLPPELGYWDRWLDVVVSVGVAATVVEILAGRNHRLVARLAREARVDNLTGLLNRRGFSERAIVELARSRREGSSLALVSFDLDHFKVVNDEWGHDVGDRVLVSTSLAFASELRAADVLARMGGEEFVALLPGSGAVDAGALGERVRTSLLAHHRPGQPRVTVSAGVAAAVAPTEIEQLLKAADRALYAAKGGGRNRTVVAEGGAKAVGSLP